MVVHLPKEIFTSSKGNLRKKSNVGSSMVSYVNLLSCSRSFSEADTSEVNGYKSINQSN